MYATKAKKKTFILEIQFSSIERKSVEYIKTAEISFFPVPSIPRPRVPTIPTIVMLSIEER